MTKRLGVCGEVGDERRCFSLGARRRRLTRYRQHAPEGRWLLVARVVWMTLFVLNLAWFGLALVAQVAAIQHPCVAATCTVTPSQAERLRHLGIGLGTVAAYYIGTPALSVLAGLFLALLLFWRRSDDQLALVVGLFLVYRVSTFAFGAANLNTAGPPALALPLGLADEIIYYAVFLIFPDGRFVPRWTWLLLVAWAGHELVGVLELQAGITLPSWVAFPWALGFPVLYLSAVAIQVYRYRRVSTAQQQQQTKWIVLGVTLTLGANILYWIVLPLAIPPFLTPASLHTVTLLYPIAIQRHQLFDIDVLIRRTLVYGSLTLLLAAVYFGSVVGMQQLVHAVTGQQAEQNPLVIVLSTLLIAALFTPLRRILQAAIDRRFFRAKYDAARTVERFAATLRNEVDLSELHEHLVAVVRETMQPASVSLWLREVGKTPKAERPVSSD